MTPTITAFERSPDGGKGLARDMRVRWALEESGQACQVRLVSFQALKEPAHLRLHPFGQIPTYEQGGLTLFESGAIVLHIAEGHAGLLPGDADARARAIMWMFAALNSVEMAILPWSIFRFFDDTESTPGREHLEKFLDKRLQHMEAVLENCEWLAGGFSVADILMADVLRLVDRFDGLAEHPACHDYVARATARPSFIKAHADQMAHFAAAD